MVRIASISSASFIDPICAAKAEPERPATMIAVIRTPSSRRVTRPIRLIVSISAPNWRNCTAPCCPITMPISRLISPMMQQRSEQGHAYEAEEAEQVGRGLGEAQRGGADAEGELRQRRVARARQRRPVGDLHALDQRLVGWIGCAQLDRRAVMREMAQPAGDQVGACGVHRRDLGKFHLHMPRLPVLGAGERLLDRMGVGDHPVAASDQAQRVVIPLQPRPRFCAHDGSPKTRSATFPGRGAA
jgi:hypothetical protein